MDRPIIKDKAVEAYVIHLEKNLSIYNRSPYLNSYLSVLQFIDNCNEQLKENKVKLFDDKGSKDFERTSKYVAELKDYLDSLEYVRNKMNPSEVREATVQAQALGMNWAEKGAFGV